MLKRWCMLVAGMCVLAVSLRIQAEFYPERIYKERTKTSLNMGWKFFRGDPTTGDPSTVSFNDAGWMTVNIPHSASYDTPTGEAETSHYKGNCWYRLHFTVPPSKHIGKYFLEFEGAMQIADVWLNGEKLGTHDNSGYTWFSFDISGDKGLSLTGDNVLAVRLNNVYNGSIPPGCDGSAGIFPDYLLYSGLYRDVWLIATNECHIPLYGQQISAPKETVSASSAVIRIKTSVASASAGEVTVYHLVDDPSGNVVSIDSLVQSVAANATTVFDKTVGPISQPMLWSPETPNLYTVYTQVVKDGILVDDYVDRVGIRWFDWTWDEGFSLNGTVTILKGASIHQSLGWIENALPTSRFALEVKLAKEMGLNSLRTAHFPRDPSFYNACDELGMLVLAEVPTWGTTTSAYPDSFWVRLNNCMREMIEVGYNHPSIIAWGLFNEPHSAYDASNQIPLEANTAHQMDSTRPTYLADNNLQIPELVALTDLVGQNYGELTGACEAIQKPIFNSEYHQGWLDWCYRGAENDNASATGYAMTRWNLWTNLFTIPRTNTLAGAYMWSFNDYWSEFMKDKPMGVVDHYRIPKTVFYLFRQYWTGVESEAPVAGLTPTTLQLDCDNETLICDSTDIAIITASLRDESGTCVFIGKIDKENKLVESTPVTFSVSGPADFFGTPTVNSIAGKCALMIKSKNTPGTITVTASAPDLPEATPVTITSSEADLSPLPFKGVVSVSHKKNIPSSKRLVVNQTGKRIVVLFPARKNVTDRVFLYTALGRKVPCPTAFKRASVSIDISNLAAGYYSLSIGEGMNYVKKIAVVK
ncbi:MAG: beta galactosidase jelly roll domain-containing protein [Chitinispirillaceae bacterium]|nr:beta galactosidase jelly roll domain-containing protein [Chitinispirillaceae bacterium]